MRWGGAISSCGAAWANGAPAVVMHRQDAAGLEPHGVLLLQVEGERIVGLDTFFGQEVVAAFDAGRLTPRAAADAEADPDQRAPRPAAAVRRWFQPTQPSR